MSRIQYSFISPDLRLVSPERSRELSGAAITSLLSEINSNINAPIAAVFVGSDIAVLMRDFAADRGELPKLGSMFDPNQVAAQHETLGMILNTPVFDGTFHGLSSTEVVCAAFRYYPEECNANDPRPPELELVYQAGFIAKPNL